MRLKSTLRLLTIAALACGSYAFGQGATFGEKPGDPRISEGGLMLEPFISFARETSEIKTSQLPVISDDTSGSSDAFGVGARIGGHVFETVFLGADARASRNEFRDSAYGSANGWAYNLAPVIGVQMPYAGIRLYGEYVVLGQFDPGAGRNGFDAKFRNPTGPRVGVGLHFGPVGVNVEYQDLKYDSADIQSYGIINTTGKTNVDYVSRGYLASVSFPIEL